MRFLRAGLVGVLTAGAIGAFAQAGSDGWYYECIDPMNMMPYTTDYGFNAIQNDFIGFALGHSGSVTYGGQNGPCYGPSSRTLNATGRMAFWIGPVGSRQSSFDDFLALTVGAPIDPVGDYCYAQIIRYSDPAADDASKVHLFGDGGLAGFFSGLSGNYTVGSYRENNVDTTLTVRLLGDAARLEWRMQNLDTNPQRLGIRFGAYVGMRTANAGILDANGNNQSGSSLPTATGLYFQKLSNDPVAPYVGYVVPDTTKPVRSERNWLAKNSGFPTTCSFYFGQSTPYGLRVDNLTKSETSDATSAAQFIIGNHGGHQSPSLLFNNVMRPRVFNDFGTGDPILNSNPQPILDNSDTLLDEVSFMQVFAPVQTASGGVRTVVHYIRAPWSFGDYNLPYPALIDTPKVIATSDSPDATNNGLNPNPFTVYAYLDNQYVKLDQAIPITNAKVTIFLPEDGSLRLAAGESQSKTIAKVDPNNTAAVSWSIVADGQVNGEIPFTIKFEPVPGQAKTVAAKVLVSATPRLRLAQGPNLVTFPWNFLDSSLDKILGLTSGVDYVAYKWIPDQGLYQPVQSVTRGEGVWIVPNNELQYLTLNGASPVPGVVNQDYLYNLRPGWNMIGNPTQYPIQLSQLVGVAEDSPKEALTWQQLVDGGLITPSLAYWNRNPDDPFAGSYSFTQASTDFVLPNQGYWIYVKSQKPIRLNWPAVFTPGLPGSVRSASTNAWKQTEKNWRLQLVARTNSSLDAANYVGVAESSTLATRLATPKPPKAPNSKIELSIVDTFDGKPTRLAQAYTDKAKRTQWTVRVRAEEPGDVTVTWPNIATIPTNVRFQVVDKASNLTRDIRYSSSYTFHMDQAGERELALQMEPTTVTKAIIGSVVVNRATKDVRAPFTISYNLSGPATTSIRILGGNGKEVYTVSRGRADNAGENSAVWTMRDNANRSVAPGSYRVEIVAETSGGERVRRIVPINVVR